jgi:tyrosine-protein kinase
MRNLRIEYLRRLAARILVLPALGLLVGLMAAAVTTFIVPSTYQATASVIVASTAANSPAAVRLSDVSLAQNLTSSVAQLAQSREVAVVAAGALSVPEKQVAGRISGVAQLGIQIVKVRAKADTAAKAAALADAAAGALIKVSNALHLGGSAVSVQPLDKAGIPSQAIAPRPLLIYVLGAFVGLLIGVGFLSLRARVGDRFRRVADVESELELPAIGVIRRPVPHRGVRSAHSLFAGNEVGAAVDGLVSALSVLVGQKPGRRIVVTGVSDENSAAFVAALLAVGVQRQDHHTTLLEGTLRNAVVHRYFPDEDSPSVQGILSRQQSSEQYSADTLAVLTLAAVSSYFDLDPSFEQVGALTDALASSGDDVIVIAPSVLAGRGLSALARHADVVILAVDSDRTRRADAGRASLLVQRLGVSLAAIVVTGSAAEEDGWQPAAWPTPLAPKSLQSTQTRTQLGAS